MLFQKKCNFSKPRNWRLCLGGCKEGLGGISRKEGGGEGSVRRCVNKPEEEEEVGRVVGFPGSIMRQKEKEEEGPKPHADQGKMISFAPPTFFRFFFFFFHSFMRKGGNRGGDDDDGCEEMKLFPIHSQTSFFLARNVAGSG